MLIIYFFHIYLLAERVEYTMFLLAFYYILLLVFIYCYGIYLTIWLSFGIYDEVEAIEFEKAFTDIL